MNKVTRQLDFSPSVRNQIKRRDSGCIFCRMNYYTNEIKNSFETQNFQIMHYIPRSQQGMGIEQNGAVGCLFHHNMYDNGNKGRREEMHQLFRTYLETQYEDWNEEELIYQKPIERTLKEMKKAETKTSPKNTSYLSLNLKIDDTNYHEYLRIMAAIKNVSITRYLQNLILEDYKRNSEVYEKISKLKDNF